MGWENYLKPTHVIKDSYLRYMKSYQILITMKTKIKLESGQRTGGLSLRRTHRHRRSGKMLVTPGDRKVHAGAHDKRGGSE